MSFLVDERNLVWQSEVKKLVCCVEQVGAPVAERTHAEVVPAAPVALVIFVGEVVPWTCAEPCVPVHVGRYGLSVRHLVHACVVAVPAAWVVHVGVDGCHIFYYTPLFPLLKLEVVTLGVALVAHLCHHLGVLACCFHHEFRLYERARHGFLEIDVFAVAQRVHGYGEVNVVRHCCHDGVEVVAVGLEHLAEVAKPLCLRIFVEHLLTLLAVEVDVA